MYDFEKLIENYKQYRLNKLDYMIGGILFLFAIIVYTLTLTPSLSAGDNGELTTAAYYLGIAHAPGYPLHTLMCKLFTFIPIRNVGWRVNFFSAFCGAVTIYLAFFVIIKLMRSVNIDKTAAYVSSACAAAAFTLSDTLWSQSVICEVYALTSIFIPAMLLVILKWQDKIIENRYNEYPYFGEPYLVLLTFLFGVSLTNHQTIMGIVPFAAIYILFVLFIFSFRHRKLSEMQIFHGAVIMLVMLVVMGIGGYKYLQKIAALDSFLYIKANLQEGLFFFIGANILFYGIYFYYKLIEPNKIDHHNYIFKFYFLMGNLFAFFYLGFAIYTSIVIRSHGWPPINWMGISETKDWWIKLAKVFNIIHRKQYGNMGKNPGSVQIYFRELWFAMTNLYPSQYFKGFLLIAVLGLVNLFRKYKLWFYSVITILITFNLLIIRFVGWQGFSKRTIFFNSVFFILPYFTIAICIGFGVAYIYELISLLVYKKDELNTNKIDIKNKNETPIEATTEA